MSISSTRRTRDGAVASVPRPSGPARSVAAPSVAASPVKSRRRPALAALGVVLVVTGGVGAAWLVSDAGGTVSVLAVAHDVPRGHVLEPEDLVTARTIPDAALQVVPSDHLGDLIGQRAAVSLPAGSLLTPSSTTSAVVPGEGQSVVGISLSTAQMPATTLLTGDRVRIVSTPPTQAEPPGEAPDTVQGEVVDVAAPDQAGSTTVDVLVPSLEAADLAARAATGRVALVLGSRVD